uniref:Ig-like domain-containing protein n=1 Tax=Catharus ustulatus TaxID=91951 RepID=A0A8C3TZR2_CATUS
MEPQTWTKCPFLSTILHIFCNVSRSLADTGPANPQVIQLLLTGLFANISSAEVSSVALVGDIPVFTLDPANWSIHFHWPWVRQAAAEGDGEKIMSQYKIGLRNMIRFVHETGTSPLALPLTDPLVVQFRAGCVLYPNETRHAFLNAGWGGRDLMAFEVDKQRWEARQTSQVPPILGPSYAPLGLSPPLCSHSPELPVATVFAHTPSLDQLLLVCHVTGFYPRPISVAWLRDGQEVPPGPALNTSTILPNADLTYQLRSVLAVVPHDGHSYVCRVRHQSLGTRSLLIPWENGSKAPTISITIAVLLLVATASAGGFWWWKHR